MSPGPAILMAISNALRYGPGSVVFSALGNSLGHIVLGFAVAFGLAALMKASATAFLALKTIGAIYLIYLGIKLWRSPSDLQIKNEHAEPAKPRHRLFLEAFLLSITNPKGLLLLAVLLPPFIDANKSVATQVALLAATFAFLTFVNHMALAIMSGRARTFLSSSERVKRVQRALGATFVAFGVSLAFASR